jgi:ribonuclease Z
MIFSLTILGSGAALPTLYRFPSSQVIQADRRSYLIDCAEGTQIQFRRFNIKYRQLRVIFISHLHGDHVFGLPGLLSSLSMQDRADALDIYGPPFLEEWLEGQLKYFTPLAFPLHFHTVNAQNPEMIYEDRHLSVSCFPLKHRIPSWGYLFREKRKPLNIRKDMIDFYRIPVREIPVIKSGADFRTPAGEIIPNNRLTLPPAPQRSYAYCSDTVFMENLPEIVRGVSLLYHEATFGNDAGQKAKETFHSTAEDAARIAKAACVKRLIIGHFSARYRDISPLLNEARSIFENTEAAEDGKVFTVEN